MRQLNLPQKPITTARIWVSFVLILLSFVFAFMPLLQINLQDAQVKANMQTVLDSLDEEYGDDGVKNVVPDKIDVSTVKVGKAMFMYAKLVLASINASSNSSYDALEQKVEQELGSPEGREAVVMTMALLSQAVDLESLLGTSEDNWEPTVSYYSDEDMEKALGELYEKGAFEYRSYTLNAYLETQYKLFCADKTAYLKSIGCAGKSIEKFQEIPAKNVFTHMRTLICAYMADELAYYENAPTRINYDKIPDYIEEYMDWGAENIYESALYGIPSYVENNMADVLKDHMDVYTVEMVFGNQASRMLAVMMKEKVLSTSQYNKLMEEMAEDGADIRYMSLDNLFTTYLDFSEDEMDEAFNALYEADAYYAVTGVDIADADKVDAETVGTIKAGLGAMLIFYIVAYVMVWPLILFICAMITLKRAISAMKNPADAPKVAACMLLPLEFTISTLLLLTFFPNVTWGLGTTVIFILSLVSVVLNVVVSRLRAYKPNDFKYATVVQGTAALSAVGLTVYTLSVLKTGFLRNFMDTMVNYIAKVTSQLTIYNQEVKFYQRFFDRSSMYTASSTSNYLLDLLLLFAAALIAFVVVCTVVRTFAARLGLVKHKPSSVSAFSLVSPIFALISCALPIVASKIENNVTFVRTARGVKAVTNGALFTIGDSQNALIGMFVGAGLMLAAAIAFLILRKTLCSGTTDIEAKLVLLGNAPAYVPPVAEAPVAEAPAAEAPVAEAPAAEAPAEETPAEETPAEETPAEEAPAEEAPAEEAPAENTEA